MQDNLSLLTIISIVVAVLVILRLRSVLGRRTSDDEARIERQMRAREAQQRAAAAGEKVVTLPGRATQPAPQSQEPAIDREAAEARIRAFSEGATDVSDGLIAIFRADNTFEPESFMSGAKQAYEMIVTAFAEGNARLLKDLLSRDVYDGFVQAISEREELGQKIDQSFVGINSAKIIEAEARDGAHAFVTVKFVSQLISATRDAAGEVVSGDPQRVQDVTDIWTFSRDLRSRDPNWRLVGTQAPN
ncbi:MAG: Tim44/TimA family putative adaptor protein [Hyphomicrobiaceae bacterium]